MQRVRVRARHYAEFNGWMVVKTYDLAGVSGKSVGEHLKRHRMLRDVKRSHIQATDFIESRSFGAQYEGTACAQGANRRE